ncbi:SDR family NAD(P)-dependent oxidoreductase [Dactylosporangium sp. CA-233914]|uniref:SDR family NAD(P)-dependent oxidoreductase n=1 Tax=Dactylosporangium sp. CA-233914 TaxID=3239934 RepID=UPI003D89DCCE
MPPLNPADVETCLRVLDALDEADDTGAAAVWAAVDKAYKIRKKRLKGERRAAVAQHDRRLLTAPRPAEGAELLRARNCYVCKAPYRAVPATYPQMCADCAAGNTARRHARADLTGRRALLTGGRIKIGFETALKLLRDGAEVVVTTRFPRDAERRYAGVPDAADWRDRLHIHGVDFLDLPGVLGLADAVAAQWGHLDILVNNAAQTIQRPPSYYRELAAAEGRPALAASATDLFFPAGALDETGEPLDLRPVNSWMLKVHQVTPREWMEVQVINAFVPFLLTARLRPLLHASPFPDRYVVNVSAMEGSFSRRNKTADHPHTNMAKAGLNMLTRTIAGEYAAEGIHVTSVDTGWVTDERPQATREALHGKGFRVPLDVVDGAARVYDPIVRGVHGDPVHGVFLKDYRVVQW